MAEALFRANVLVCGGTGCSASKSTDVVDALGDILLTNSKATDLFHYAPDELAGLSIEVLMPERYRLGHQQYRESFAAMPHVRAMGSGLDLAARRRRTWRNLGVGLLILAVSLALGAGITSLDFLSAGLRALLSNAVSILGTVALWTPVDAWLFGLRPLQSTIRVYTAIRNATVEIR